MIKVFWGVVVVEVIFLVVLVVVTVADKAPPLDRWALVILPLATALIVIVDKSRRD
jgi:hypothetical protein